MPNPVPKGPQAKTQKKADAIAGLVLKEVFKPELGRGQFTDAHKQTLIGSINVSLGQNGFEQNYSIKRLDAWLSNTLVRAPAAPSPSPRFAATRSPLWFRVP